MGRPSCTAAGLSCGLKLDRSLSLESLPQICPSQQAGDFSIGIVLKAELGKTVFVSYSGEGRLSCTPMSAPPGESYRLYFHTSQASLLSCEKFFTNKNMKAHAFLYWNNKWLDLGDHYYVCSLSLKRYFLFPAEYVPCSMVGLPNDKRDGFLFFSIGLNSKGYRDITAMWQLTRFTDEGKIILQKLDEILKKAGVKYYRELLTATPPVYAANRLMCYVHVKWGEQPRQVIRLYLDDSEVSFFPQSHEEHQASVVEIAPHTASASSSVPSVPVPPSLGLSVAAGGSSILEAPTLDEVNNILKALEGSGAWDPPGVLGTTPQIQAAVSPASELFAPRSLENRAAPSSSWDSIESFEQFLKRFDENFLEAQRLGYTLPEPSSSSMASTFLHPHKRKLEEQERKILEVLEEGKIPTLVLSILRF